MRAFARLPGLRALRSMRTAIYLLIALVIATVVPTLVPQRITNPEKVAEIGRTHPYWFSVGERLRVFDVFTSPWYMAIWVSLLVVLLLCLLPRTRVRSAGTAFHRHPESGNAAAPAPHRRVAHRCRARSGRRAGAVGAAPPPVAPGPCERRRAVRRREGDRARGRQPALPLVAVPTPDGARRHEVPGLRGPGGDRRGQGVRRGADRLRRVDEPWQPRRLGAPRLHRRPRPLPGRRPRHRRNARLRVGRARHRRRPRGVRPAGAPERASQLPRREDVPALVRLGTRGRRARPQRQGRLRRLRAHAAGRAAARGPAC